MNCPYCGNELSYLNKYEFIDRDADFILHSGDIYQCDNLDCESSVFDSLFYTIYDNTKLYEGCSY